MANEVTTVLNAQVKTTTSTQTGNAELGTKDKTMYYLIIITDKGKHVINVGEGTVNKINELLPKKGGK